MGLRQALRHTKPGTDRSPGVTLQFGQLPLNSSELSKARCRERLSLCHLGVRKRRTRARVSGSQP